MPPHCDAMDGPVVTAARRALETGNVNFILPWVPKAAEEEVGRAFERTRRVRALGEDARALADHWFFETAVRLHQAGEGAPYTGLKPGGLDPGPVLPRAERAIAQGFTDGLADFLLHDIGDVLDTKFRAVLARKPSDEHDVEAARAYVQAAMAFVRFAHRLYEFVHSGERPVAAVPGPRQPVRGQQAA
ncbi:MAG: DUF6448 family protein [Armatimonadota bacterium]|nr:DUF6448 family protein [Armatimonadota bacterium]MDR7549161.1 DUF6448 family protein [Armatimonadota bacterium]